MGTTLTGTTPQDTYDSLIKVTDNGPLSGTAKYLSDGLGNDSKLALSTGNIGINTTTPDIFGRFYTYSLGLDSSGSTAFQIDGTSYSIIDMGANGVRLGFLSQSGTETSLGNLSTIPLIFQTNSAERMRITSAGNVGIGTSSPQQKLHVAGIAANSYALLGTSTNWGAADTNRIKIGSTGDTFTLGCDLRANTNYAGTTETSLGLWVTNGSSTMVEVVRATQNGLTFNGDTAAANALDDYEEGTWTMGITFGGASVGVTYGANTGTYTKIGQQVTVNGVLVITNKGTSTGIAQISGLPFTVKSSVSNYSAPSFRFENVANTGTLQGYGNVGTTFVPIEQINTAGVASAVFDTDFSNNSSILISFTYFV